jgi:hypothetical protein
MREAAHEKCLLCRREAVVDVAESGVRPLSSLLPPPCLATLPDLHSGFY